jgi:hypothetical protein
LPAPGYAGYGGYGAAPVAYPVYAPAQKTNGLAIGSMVTSIAGVVLLICYGAGAVVGVVGAILGHIARRQIRERQESGDGMALAGIIVGWISLGLGVVVGGLMVALVFFAARTAPPSGGFVDVLRLFLIA